MPCCRGTPGPTASMCEGAKVVVEGGEGLRWQPRVVVTSDAVGVFTYIRGGGSILEHVPRRLRIALVDDRDVGKAHACAHAVGDADIEAAQVGARLRRARRQRRLHAAARGLGRAADPF